MIEIVKIKRNDLPDLALLFKELSGKETDINKMLQCFELMEKNQGYYVLGAIYNGILVGSLMGIICLDLVGECQPFMVIENVIVSSEFRGIGIGKKLMIEIERVAKEKNCSYTMFVSGTKRKEAHKFYESLGYNLDEVQGFKKYLV